MAVRSSALPATPFRSRPLVRWRIPCRATALLVRRRPLLMGVLNVTPDSFSDGGRYLDAEAAVAHGERLAAEGADLIDVGGESTRPGARPVAAEDEQRRIYPVIARLARRVRIPISVDTSKASVAEAALDAGAVLVNDVTALRGDPRMAGVVARARAAIILMHMRGTPQTMQRHPRYRDVVAEVGAFLGEAAERAQARGISRERILVDPGLGFGKLLSHNLALLRGLPRLAALGYPLLLGPSRKAFIGQVLGVDVAERLPGTLACVAQAFYSGVSLVRVHDVAAAAQLVRMLEAIDAARRQH